jgi:hypothetical protein
MAELKALKHLVRKLGKYDLDLLAAGKRDDYKIYGGLC